MRSGWLAVLWLVGGCRSGFDDLWDARGRGDANDAQGNDTNVPDDGSTDGSTDGSIPLTCAGRSPITGQTWWVATTGNDSNPGTQASPVATITHAVSLASATGGTVVVTPGTYAAEPGGAVTISTTKPLRVVAEQRYRAVVPRFVCQTCTDLTIESFEVTGASLPLLQLNGGARVTVLDNVVHNSSSAGIRVTSSADTIAVVGNLVYDNAASDIHFNVASNITVRGNIVFNDTLSPNGLSKIWLESATTATVDGNVVFRVRGTDNSYGLISLRATSATTVENNVVAASPNATSVYAPIGFNQASGSATIRHNTFAGPLPGNAFGLGVTSLSSGTYTFINNVWASAGTNQPFTWGNAPSGTITVRHNLFWNAPSGAFTSGGTPNSTNDSESRIVDPGISFATVPAAPRGRRARSSLPAARRPSATCARSSCRRSQRYRRRAWRSAPRIRRSDRAPTCSASHDRIQRRSAPSSLDQSSSEQRLFHATTDSAVATLVGAQTVTAAARPQTRSTSLAVWVRVNA